MTCRAGKTGEGTAPVVPRPGSCAQAAVEALVRFSEEERLFGAAKAHDLFDGILAEHALALEEVRDELREALVGRPGFWQMPIRVAAEKLDEQINYVRALGSVAATEEEEDGK